MFNEDSLQDYFHTIIKADNNPYTIVSQTTFKENGLVRTEKSEELIYLKPIKDLISDIIKNASCQTIDVYPKNFIQKIFNPDKKKLKSFTSKQSDFLLVSENTVSKLRNLKITLENYQIINIDDVIIIGNKGRIVWTETSGKIEVNYDPSLINVIKIF